MLLFELIAEQKIADAIARGELADLPGEGRQLDLSDDSLIPEDVRMAYRILKNAGFVPPELERMREIGELERLVHSSGEGPQRDLASKKLRLLRLRMDESRQPRPSFASARGYLDKILARLG
jgi:hypothetical protein